MVHHPTGYSPLVVAPSLSTHLVRARFACHRAATFDCDRPDLYRYVLYRSWTGTPLLSLPPLPHVNFVMLNPSAADADHDDRTIVRCMHYARRWGYGGLTITNLYALRSTDARALRHHPDPIGPGNDAHLAEQAAVAALVVCAWGAGQDTSGDRLPEGRGRHVKRLLHNVLGRNASLHVLRLGTSGAPLHPLYLPAHLTPQPWKG